MPETPGPDDRLGRSLVALWSKAEGGYRGALVGLSTQRWEWECNHNPPHPTKEEAHGCAWAELKARRKRLNSSS
jgi:hypothetical protein